MTEYPRESEDCEKSFLDEEGFELACGERDIHGDWNLCEECLKIPENKRFIEGGDV